MAKEDDWADKAKRLLRTEMVRRGVSYEGLSEALLKLGIEDTPVNLRNKVSRGKFSAAFLVMCCEAMGVKELILLDA